MNVLNPEHPRDVVLNRKVIIKDAFTRMEMRTKPVLLVGPPGTGKTFTAYLFARVNDLPLVEINASSFRRHDDVALVLNTLIGMALAVSDSEPLPTVKRKVVLLDEIDGMAPFINKRNRKKIKMLTEALKKSPHHVVLTANDLKKVPKPIKDACTIIRYPIPSPTEYEEWFRRAAQYHPDQVTFDESILKKMMGRDIRNALSLIKSGMQSGSTNGIEGSRRFVSREDVVKLLFLTGRLPKAAWNYNPSTLARDVLMNVVSFYLSPRSRQDEGNGDAIKQLKKVMDIVNRATMVDVYKNPAFLDGIPKTGVTWMSPVTRDPVSSR